MFTDVFILGLSILCLVAVLVLVFTNGADSRRREDRD